MGGSRFESFECKAGPEPAPTHREMNIGNTRSAGRVLDAPACPAGMMTAQEQSVHPFIAVRMYLDMRAGNS